LATRQPRVALPSTPSLICTEQRDDRDGFAVPGKDIAASVPADGAGHSIVTCRVSEAPTRAIHRHGIALREQRPTDGARFTDYSPSVATRISVHLLFPLRPRGLVQRHPRN